MNVGENWQARYHVTKEALARAEARAAELEMCLGAMLARIIPKGSGYVVDGMLPPKLYERAHNAWLDATASASVEHSDTGPEAEMATAVCRGSYPHGSTGRDATSAGCPTRDEGPSESKIGVTGGERPAFYCSRCSGLYEHGESCPAQRASEAEPDWVADAGAHQRRMNEARAPKQGYSLSEGLPMKEASKVIAAGDNFPILQPGFEIAKPLPEPPGDHVQAPRARRGGRVKPCEYCGTPVDESDYQDDGHRHTDGRCAEHLNAALSAVNKHAAGLAQLVTHLQSELDQQRGRAEAAEHKLTQIRAVVENYNDHWQDFSAWSAIAAIEELKP